MAGGAVVGALRVTLGIDTAVFTQGLTKAQKELGKAGAQISGLGKSLTLGLTTPLLGFGALAMTEAKEAAAAMGQVNAALTSMGPVAGRTAEQLKAAADSLEMRSLYEGDEILTKVTANLLTFGNVSGDVFDRAQQSIVDIATRMGGDLQAATVMVGKALNDPVKGLSALRKVGIQFTDQQKDQITAMMKAGDVAGAQSIMLKELERQFSGSAQAAQNTDPWNKMSDAFKSIAESIGNILLPLIPPFANALASVAAAFTGLSPETQKWIAIGGGIVAVLGPILIAIGALVSGIGVLLPVIVAIGGGLATFAAVVTGVAMPAIAALIVALAPILIPLAAVAAAVGAVYLVWKNWDTIGPILTRLWNTVKAVVVDGIGKALDFGKKAVQLWLDFHVKAFNFLGGIAGQLYTALKSWLQDKMSAVWNWVLGKIAAVKQAFFDLYDAVVGHSYIPDMVDGIAAHMARLPAVMVNPALQAVSAAAVGFKTGTKLMADETDKNTDRMGQSFLDMTRDISGALQGLIGAIKGGDFFDIFTGVLDLLAGIGRATGGFKLGPLKFPGSGGGGGGGGFGVPGFATGGSFKVGGSGGIDSNLIQFRATRGEMVDIRRPGQDRGGRGMVFDMRGAIVTQELMAQINGQISAGEARAVRGGASLAMAQQAKIGRRRLA